MPTIIVTIYKPHAFTGSRGGEVGVQMGSSNAIWNQFSPSPTHTHKNTQALMAFRSAKYIHIHIYILGTLSRARVRPGTTSMLRVGFFGEEGLAHMHTLNTLGCAGIVVDAEVEVRGRYLGGVCAAHAHTYAFDAHTRHNHIHIRIWRRAGRATETARVREERTEIFGWLVGFDFGLDLGSVVCVLQSN